MHTADSSSRVDILRPLETTPTMSSREIANLTDKKHSHVLRDIRSMLGRLEVGLSNFGSSYLNEQNKPQPEFLLPKRECLILVSGYSTELRAKIIDRWIELEAVIGNAPPDLGLIEFADQARAHNEVVRDLVASESRSTRGAVIHAIKELAGSPLAALKSYLDDRFKASHERDKMMIGNMQALGRGLAEVVRLTGATVELANKSLSVSTIVESDWVTVQGIYGIAGVPLSVPGKRSLSGRVMASLTAYSFEVDRQMEIRCPQFDRSQRLYRATLVKAWLQDRGRFLIDQHLAKHSDQKVIRFPGSDEGEVR